MSTSRRFLHRLVATILAVVVLSFSGVALHAQAEPVITSVSGCVDVGNSTTQCMFPTLLTIRGSGFLTGVTTGGSFYVRAPHYWVHPSVAMSAEAATKGWALNSQFANTRFPCNDSYFVYSLLYPGVGVYDFNTMVTVSVTLGDSNSWKSPPFTGIGIAPVTPPAVTSISGCPNVSADGLTTTGCLPDLNVLTVTGSGFLLWQTVPLNVLIGSTTAGLYLALSGGSWSGTLINDSAMLILLDVNYRALLAAHDFGGPVLPLYIQQPVTGQLTSPLYVQFAPLPPPSYSSIIPYNLISVNPLCQWNANRTALVQCVAGGSGIQIRGHYLYGLTVTAGGLPMSLTSQAQQDVTLTALTTPLYNYEPGVPYDLVMTAVSGTLVVPGFLSFSAAPALVTAACRDPTIPYTAGAINCLPGDTLVVNGPNLPASSTPFTITLTSSRSGLNSTCSNTRYQSATQLACDFTQPGLPSTTGWDAIYVQWATGLSFALTNRFDVWGAPNAPRIKTITATGCGNPVNSTNLTLVGCHGGEQVTVMGFNFLAYSAFTMGMTPWSLSYFQLTNLWSLATQCADFAVIDDSTAVCVLPYVEDSPLLSYGVPMMMAMVNYSLPMVSGSHSQSNFLFFTFTQGSAPVTGPSSSSSMATTVAVSVVFGVLGFVAVVCVAVLLVRRRRKAARRSPRADSESESALEFSGDLSVWSHLPGSKEVELAPP